jgi:hypothetical protein
LKKFASELTGVTSPHRDYAADTLALAMSLPHLCMSGERRSWRKIIDIVAGVEVTTGLPVDLANMSPPSTERYLRCSDVRKR